MAAFHELTTSQLRQGLQLREQIETLQQKLDALFGGKAPATSSTPKEGKTRRRRKMSAAGRARIAAAQKARWAKSKSKTTTAKAPAAKGTRKRRGITSEGRAKLAAAMKARWAARKKAATGGSADKA